MALKILLCDDEIEILESLGFILSKEGYDVLCASSGNKAVELLKNVPVDLIICDFMMNDGNGEVVLNWARQNSLVRPGNFIFFSAHVNLINYADRTVTIIPKPNVHSLLQYLREYLSKSKKEIDVQ